MTIILAYHRVNPGPRGGLSVTTAEFREQLLYLLNRGYRNVALDDLVQPLAHGTQRVAAAPPARGRLTGLERSEGGFLGTLSAGNGRFAITFDDGYRDNYLHAMPILRELQLKATIFVTVSHVDTEQPYPWDHVRVHAWGGLFGEEDLSVTWKQIDEMRRSGIFTIGSHTLSHVELARVDSETARYEIRESKRILEDRLGEPVLQFCYPRGNLNRQVVSMVRDAGYALGVVTPPRPVPRSIYTLPRAGIYEGTHLRYFKRKTGRLYQTLLWTGILPYVQQVRLKVIGSRP